MDDAGESQTPQDRKTAAPARGVRGTAMLPTSAYANLAALRTTGVLAAQLKGIAAQVALPSARYADLFAAMSTSRVFAQTSSLDRIASANIAVNTLTRNPAWLEATRGLSKSLETQHASVLLKVLGDFQTSGVVAQATERWASQHADLLANAKFQLPALSSTLLPGVARPSSNALLLGKFVDVMREMNAGVAGTLAAQQAASVTARSVTLGLSEEFRSRGIASPAWQRMFQDVQLVDGLGSIARLAAVPGPLLRSRTLASGVSSYASVQRVLSDIARDRNDALLRGRSLAPATTLNAYFDSLGARPWHRRAELAGLIGNATSGLVLGESLTVELDDDDGDLLVDTAVTELIEPWQEGFDETRAELFAALENLSPHLANLLRGAWFNIKANGPAAAASAANCLVEVLDQTLHALVDDALLPAWLSDRGYGGRDYVDPITGRPTRRARIAYVVKTRSKRDAQLLRGLEAGLAASLSPLHAHLESGKHGRVDVGVQAVRCHAVAVEGFLINLLLG